MSLEPSEGCTSGRRGWGADGERLLLMPSGPGGPHGSHAVTCAYHDHPSLHTCAYAIPRPGTPARNLSATQIPITDQGLQTLSARKSPS